MSGMAAVGVMSTSTSKIAAVGLELQPPPQARGEGADGLVVGRLEAHAHERGQVGQPRRVVLLLLDAEPQAHGPGTEPGGDRVGEVHVDRDQLGPGGRGQRLGGG
jgi:hypothetical protein